MSDTSAVRDKRPPFCYQTLDALAVLRQHFTGARRATALGIYVTMTEVANSVGGAAARDGFSVTRKTIAERAGVTVKTFDAYMRELEEIGLVEVERIKVGDVNLPNVWHLIDPRDPPRESDDPRVEKLTTPFARDPGLEVQKLIDQEENGPPVVPQPDNRPGKVNGKPVTDHEYGLAATILIEFNRQAGTSYRASGFVEKIIRRIREHPELPLEAHAAVIERNLAEPWWTGAADPRVIYGNADQFERSVHNVRVQPRQRALTPDEVEQMDFGG